MVKLPLGFQQEFKLTKDFDAFYRKCPNRQITTTAGN